VLCSIWFLDLEDVQIWETVDEKGQSLSGGGRGLTVCTSLNSESSPQLRFLVGDYTTFERSTCACGRSHVRALGSFQGRADDVINLRGIKFFPSQVEQAVRAHEGVGDEFEIVLTTNSDGLDTMNVRIEHPLHAQAAEISARVADEIRRSVLPSRFSHPGPWPGQSSRRDGFATCGSDE
jgi:phenylacetate-CoA ligase